MKVLKSSIDASVNMIRGAEVGFWETRYVNRGNYQVVYLSSQSGCNHGCQFCHLTTTKQTNYRDATKIELLIQAGLGLDQCKHTGQVQGMSDVVHYNFMARGEPLANPHINDSTLIALAELAAERGFRPRFIFSTIIPKRFALREFSHLFNVVFPDIYYSLYSVDAEFRKQWLPSALEPGLALAKLKNWQDYSRKIPKIHFAPIPGACDSVESIDAVCKAIHDSGVRVDFNLVMYNPPEGMETSQPIRPMEDIAGQIASLMPWSKVDIIRRVGEDVYASCGMFFSGKE